MKKQIKANEKETKEERIARISSKQAIIIAIVTAFSGVAIALVGKWSNSGEQPRQQPSTAGAPTSTNPTQSNSPVVSTNVNGNRNVTGQQKQAPKTVVIMDNNLLVYDKRSERIGRTNIDDIRDALKDMGLTFIPQPTNLEWNEFSQVSSARPNLIIIHASCFYKETNVEDSEKKFFTFLEFVGNSLPDTKMLIYSRGFENITQREIYEKVAPNLKERIELLLVEGGRNASFRNTRTIGDLRQRVKNLLKLEG